MTEPRQITPVEEIRHSLARMEPQFQAALPAHIDTKKFVRVAVTAIQTNPGLQEADRTTLYAACTKAAQDGLLPDGRESALVIYNTNVGSKQNPRWVKAVQYLPMIAGILKKLRNSGQLSSITAQIVHKNDPFRYWIDSDGEHLEFEPQMFADRGEVIGAFAMAKLTDGALYVEVMTKMQIEAIRAASRAAQAGPWVTWWEEMAKKAAMKRLAKRLPMSSDIDQMLAQDDEYERGIAADTGVQAQDVTVQPPALAAPTPTPAAAPARRQTRARAAVDAAPAYTVEEIPARATAPQRSAPPPEPEPDDPGATGEPGEDEVPI